MLKKTIFVVSSFVLTVGVVSYFASGSIAEASDIDGKGLYMKHCKICHGEEGTPTDLGTGLGAREFSNKEWEASVTDDQIKKQIREGTPEKMMPFKDKLTPEEINALVPVVRSFAK